jgi:oligoribonuclease NrnB/cAMP/cGMP phosphodiesterase (DHH superfamily)
MIVSITHEHDLDGLGSQAIIKRYFTISNSNQANSFRIFFAQYLDFTGKVKEILNANPDLPSHMIISDIGFNDDFEELFPIFQNAKNNGCKIYWFDHHLVDDHVKARLKNTINVYINDTSRCAAEIVKDFYLPNDPIAIKIAEYARDIDFKSNIFQIANEIQMIIAYNIGVDKEENRKIIVELLSEGKFEALWFQTQLEMLEDWIKIESQFALDHVKLISVRSFGKIAIAFAEMGGGRIAKLLLEQFPDIKVAIGIDKRYHEIIIHSEYINCKNFAKRFNGGGHKARAGFKCNQIFKKENVLSSTFLKEMKQTIPKFIE